MVEYFVEDKFDHLRLKCSWQRWYVCGACIGNELLHFCTRSSSIDVVLGFLQVYTINQRYQCDLMYVLQSYVVEPASVRLESNSFSVVCCSECIHQHVHLFRYVAHARSFSVVCCSKCAPQHVLGPFVFSASFRWHDNSIHVAPLL